MLKYDLAEIPDDDAGKPTVMRYIIRDQATMAENWEGGITYTVTVLKRRHCL